MIAKQRRGDAGQLALILVDLCQALDAQRLSDAQEGRKPVLIDADLAAVHEVQEAAHVHIRHVLQYDDRVSVGMAHEQRL